MAKLAKLSKKAMRIAIAKDVLSLLKAKDSIVAKSGVYLTCSCDADALINEVPLGNAQENIDVLTKECRVCALGALFVGAVDLYNKCQLQEFGGYGNIVNKLRDFFSDKQLYLIEGCFEGHWDEKFVCRGFHNKYPEDAQRMKAIMRNIIRNEGNFVPS